MSSWETGIRYLLIDYGVQRIVSECVSHVCANWRSLKKMRLTALVSLTTHRTRTDNIYTCITWITMVLLSRQVSVVLSSCILWIKPSFTSKGKESGVDLQFCSTICAVVCKRQLSYLDANAVVVLHVVTMMQTHPFAVQVAPTILLKMSPMRYLYRFVATVIRTHRHTCEQNWSFRMLTKAVNTITYGDGFRRCSCMFSRCLK
jgi:hypothetical protein